MRTIWTSILSNPPQPIPLNESFFDLGGHSILATRLIFEVRKVFVVSNAPLGLVYDDPTIGGLAAAVDALRDADLGLSYKEPRDAGETKKATAATVEYGADLDKLLPTLRSSYSPLPAEFSERPLTVFLTGATGFLGAFVLYDLLARRGEDRVKKVICLVRAGDAEKGLARLKEGSTDRGVWSDEWVEKGRLEVVTGDLGQEMLGLDADVWKRISLEADVVLHNGALVRHFPFPLLLRSHILYRCIGSTRMSGFALPMCLLLLPPSSSRPQAHKNSTCSYLQPQPSTRSTMSHYRML
jgi:L-aminoadipate-semialdehyde dehydrogenase